MYVVVLGIDVAIGWAWGAKAPQKGGLSLPTLS